MIYIVIIAYFKLKVKKQELSNENFYKYIQKFF